MPEPFELYIAPRRDTPGAWAVEATDPENGSIELAIFVGPEAEQRAQEYAAWKFGKPVGPAMPRVMPESVKHAIETVLGMRKAEPVEIFDAIRDELARWQAIPPAS